MEWVFRFYRSSVGCKFVMAVTGLMLVGFLVAHLSGNLLVFAGPDAINAYAEKLRTLPEVLWVLRCGLMAAAILHVASGVRLARMSRAARPEAYRGTQPRKASLASRTMLLSGGVLLGFICYHLAHFTFRWTHAELFQDLGPYDVYPMIILSFQSPLVALFYVISVFLLMSHLYHGLRSLFQTLGLFHSKYNCLLDRGSAALAVVLALGFMSIPVSVWLGVLTL